ncbi:hypothetical protein ACOSP7_010383 [Xanthoceras sorbifolium]
MNFIFEVHLRRTTNPLGSRSNPEGSKIEPLWVRSRTQKGSKNDEPSGFEDRTPLGSISNPEGFEDRTLLGSCLRTQKGSCLRTLLGSRSNPEGSIFEPFGFHEPRGFVLRTLWVPRTQKGSYLRTHLRTLLGSIFEPFGFHEPRGFVLRTLWVPRTQKGSYLRTLWVPRTQRVRSSNLEGSRSNPSGFEDRTLLGFEPRRVRRSNP